MSDQPEDRPTPPEGERETVKPQGAALGWTDADLDKLSQVTPAVIADAKVDARRLPDLDALLRAKPTSRGK